MESGFINNTSPNLSDGKRQFKLQTRFLFILLSVNAINTYAFFT